MFLPLLDIGQDLLPIFIILHTGQQLLVANLPHESFTDVPHLHLEVVPMTMRPTKKGLECRFEMFADNVCGIDVDGEFDETDGRLDNFAVRGVEEDYHRGKDFIGHFFRNVIWNNKLARD